MTSDADNRGGLGPRSVSGETVVVAGVFALLTAWMFWPAAGQLWDHVFVTPGGLQADGYLITWVMAWDWHALWTTPFQLFDANSFYPAPRSLAGSEHMLGHLPLFGPVYGLTGNPSLAIQFTRLATVALCGVAMFALLRHWGVGFWAAFFGGFVYAFCPARYLTVHALQLVAMPYLPLAILYVDRVIDFGRWRDVGLLALFFSLQMLCSFYLAYMAAIAMGVYCVWALAYRLWNGRTVHWRGVVSGLAVAGAVMIASALPYANLADQGEIPEHAEAMLANFSASPWATYATRPRVDRFGRLGHAYVGIVPAVLCLAAVWGGLRKRVLPYALVASLLLAAAMYLLALGPYARVGGLEIALPYKWAAAIVPGFSSMRVPLRFTFGFLVGMSALTGLGLQSVLSTRLFRGRQAVAVVFTLACVVFTSLDYGHFRYRPQLRAVAVPGSLPEVYKRLAALDVGPLLEVPVAIHGEDGFGGLDREARYQYLSTYHWFPLLNGYTGYPPRSAAIVKRIAKSLPDERSLTLLQRMTGVRYVIVHLDQVAPDAGAAWRVAEGLSLIGEFGRDLLFAVTADRETDLLQRLISRDAGDGTTLVGTPLRALAPEQRLASVELLEPDLATTSVFAGIPVSIELRVESRSSVPWPVLTDAEDVMVAAEYAWVKDGEEAAVGSLRLPYDLAPGEAVSFAGAIPGPKTPGWYRLVVAVTQAGQRFSQPAISDRLEVREWPSK